MIIQCPACQAKFSVADGAIPAAGRQVRCSRCAHAWHCTGAAAESFASELYNVVEAVPTETPPVIKPRRASDKVARKKPNFKLSVKPFKIAAPAIAALWLVLAFITYFPSWSKAPGLSGIYHLFGAVPTDGLLFSDVHMERAQDGPKTKFILSGSIRNYAGDTRLVPTVRVVLRDKANKDIWSRDYAVKATLKAGDIYPFRIANVETAFAKNVDSIVVDVGNSLELLVR
jgi:predicted Zn finger-like uncharacterized protein